MSTSALILMLSVQIAVAAITGYLYWRVMHIDRKEEDKNSETKK